MAKLLPLDDSYRSLCSELLSEGQSLGQRLLENLESFDRLAVWVPETMDVPPPPDRMRYDVLYHPEGFGVPEEASGLFSRHLGGGERALIVAETSVRNTERWPRQERLPIKWFTCSAPPGGRDMRDRICVFLTGADASADNFDALVRHSNRYPTIIILTSLSSAPEITSGGHLTPTSQSWSELLVRVEHVLLGVFDERSYMVISRSQPPLE